MTKLFYPLLMLATASVAIALWRQQESSCHLLGPEDDPNREATGDRYDDPNADPAGMQSPNGPTNRPGMGMFPSYMPTTAPTVPSNSGRPASWPGGPATKIPDNQPSNPNGVSISNLPPSRELAPTTPVRHDPAVTPVWYQGPAVPNTPQYPNTNTLPPVGQGTMPSYTPTPVNGVPNVPPPAGPAYNSPRAAPPPNYPSAAASGAAAAPVNNQPVAGPTPPAGYPNTATLPNPQQPLSGQTQRTSFSPSSETSKLPSDFNVPLDIDGTQVISIVNGEPILAYEVMVQVNQILKENAGKIPPTELERIKEMLIKQRLKQVIEAKLWVIDAKRKLPKEALPKIETKLGEAFEEQETKKILKRANLKSRAEWDSKLRAMGSSVEREKRQFIDNTLGGQWMHQQVKNDKEVTHQDMLDYYRAHLADYEYPAQCRWEQLSVRISKHRSKQDAWQALANLGNRVYHGTPFAEVAKASSDGITAANGGTHDWTIKGSLTSTTLDQALFTLPLGQLSPIIEDQKNLHIVRVIERKEAGRKPFEETQKEIKEKIKMERMNAQYKTIVTRIHNETNVWTVYGDIMKDEEEEKAKNQAASPNKMFR